jgi:hypothetical protein
VGHPQICRQSAESRAEYSCALPVAAVPVPNCAVRDVQIGGDRAGALPVGRPQQCPANHHGEIKAAQEQKGGKKRMGSSAGNAFGPPHGDPPLADEAPVPRPPDHGHRARRTCRPGDLHPRSDRHVPLHIERALPYDRHAVLVHRVALQGCQSLAGSFSFGALIMSATVARRPNASAPEQPLRLFSVSGTAPEGRRTRTRTPSSIYVAVTGLLGPMESCRLQRVVPTRPQSNAGSHQLLHHWQDAPIAGRTSCQLEAQQHSRTPHLFASSDPRLSCSAATTSRG